MKERGPASGIRRSGLPRVGIAALVLVALAIVPGCDFLDGGLRIGNLVKVVGTGVEGLNVRDVPGGDILSTVPDGWVFEILSGPETAQIGGIAYKWWQVGDEEYDFPGLGGWVAERYLERVSRATLKPHSENRRFLDSQKAVLDAIDRANEYVENYQDYPEWYDPDLGYLCLKFVRMSYAVPLELSYESAREALDALNAQGLFYSAAESWNPPPGALVFFESNRSPQYDHVGLFLGSRKAAHVEGDGWAHSRDLGYIVQREYIDEYLGWAYPPEEWLPETPGTDQWTTFIGSPKNDAAHSIAVDADGNAYVAGYSFGSWGTPNGAFNGGADAFVAKLDSSGALVWNTFLGSGSDDSAEAVSVDASGNVYVSGWSEGNWGTGTSLNSYAGGQDAFVAKLSSSGVLLWYTFLGASALDTGSGIRVDGSGDMYVSGTSHAPWGTPINGHNGSGDAFVARLSSSGTLLWNTFMGSSNDDAGESVAIDVAGNVYVAGTSSATWGTPERHHAGGEEAFVAKFDNGGALVWNTFLGSSSDDYGMALDEDGTGSVCVTGRSWATWGMPVSSYAGGRDAFAAKLGSNGLLIWNTFMGSSDKDSGLGIDVGVGGTVHVTGHSWASWGTPEEPYTGSRDAFVAELSSDGNKLWSTFMGSSDREGGFAITVDQSGSVCVAGMSCAPWGEPVSSFSGGIDAFAAKF